MDSFVLVIDSYKLYVFEMMDKTNAEIFKIRGNDYDEIDLEDPEYSAERINNYLLDTLNYNDFSNCSFNVIYNDVGINVIYSLMGSFSSASDFEVNKLENSLVSILLKSNKISTEETKVVNFYDNSWEIELTEDGLPNIMETNDEYDIQLTVEDIPAALFSTYSFTTDKNEIKKIKTGYPKFNEQRIEESKLEEKKGVTYIKGEENLFNGYKIVFHADSKIVKSEVPYKKGRKDGLQIDYNKNGSFLNIISYKNGKKDSSAIRFHKNGRIYEVYNVKNGKKHEGYVCFNDNGRISEAVQFTNGKKYGGFISFNKNDEYIFEVKYFDNGKLNGPNIKFDNGEISSIHNYSDDEFVKQSLSFENGYLNKSYYRTNRKIINARAYKNNSKEVSYNKDGTTNSVNEIRSGTKSVEEKWNKK